jgi:hypothetical protein
MIAHLAPHDLNGCLQEKVQQCKARADWGERRKFESYGVIFA